jgi:hypothetical protein
MNNPEPWWLTWPVAEVAATILPVFSYFVRRSDIGAMNIIVNWRKTGAVDRPSSPTAGSEVGLTRLGMQALQTNTVRQHLGLSDAPPTA